MKILKVILSVLIYAIVVKGHGYINSPPARNAIWNDPQFLWANAPVNTNLHELWCGDVHQSEKIENCGICGDSPTGIQEHAKGGKYAKNIIVANYTQGQVITLDVLFTVPHMGYSEFQLCNNAQSETEACFKQNVLRLLDGSSRVPQPEMEENFHKIVQLQLPQGLTCSQCVLRWIYRGGMFYQRCEDGTYDFGCGPQQTFINCADISIRKKKLIF